MNISLKKENGLSGLMSASVFLMLFWGLSLQSTSAQSSEHQASASAPLKGIDAYVHKVMKQWQVPGLAIAVVKDGKVVLAKGYGIREVGKPGKVDANTLFPIGSITKTMTAEALGTLVSAHRLSWDAPVAQYMPHFQLRDAYVTQHITLRDLLSHRSGYCDDRAMMMTTDDSDLIQRMRFKTPDYGFRTRFCYNNMMYLASSEFIPAITGESWNRYIHEHLFVPLDMDRTISTTQDFSQASNVAMPYAIVNGKLSELRRNSFWPHNGDITTPIGGLHSSVNDLSHWMLMRLAGGHYRGKKVLDSSVLHEMQTPQQFIPDDDPLMRPLMELISPKSRYYAQGLGVQLFEYGSHTIIMHGGLSPGATSFHVIVPDARLGVVVLSNKMFNNGVIGVTCYVLQAYLGEEHRNVSQIAYAQDMRMRKHSISASKALKVTRKSGTGIPFPISAYTGLYKDDIYGTARINLEQGHLVLRLDNPRFIGDLEHWHDNTFRLRWRYRYFGDNYVTFDLDAYAVPKRFSFALGPLHFKRVEKPDSKEEDSHE